MSRESLEDLLNEFEHACRGGDYEISHQLRSEIIEREQELEKSKKKFMKWWQDEARLNNKLMKKRKHIGG